MYKFPLRLNWNLFLRFQLTTFQHLFIWWLVARSAWRHYLNQCWNVVNLNQWWLIYWHMYWSLGLNEFMVVRHQMSAKKLLVIVYIFCCVWELFCGDDWYKMTCQCPPWEITIMLPYSTLPMLTPAIQSQLFPTDLIWHSWQLLIEPNKWLQCCCDPTRAP